MKRVAWITNADEPINQMMASHLLQKEYAVHLHFRKRGAAERFADKLSAAELAACSFQVFSELTRNQIAAELQKATEKSRLDCFIFGIESFDETDGYDRSPQQYTQVISDYFNELFLWSSQVSIQFAKQRGGHILFPLINDTLYYEGYPSSPALNHGKLSMMKTMAKELAPFDVSVNAMTFGYYDRGLDGAAKRKLQKQLEIYALKPRLEKLEAMIPKLDILLEQDVCLLSGQNIHIGAGMDTAM